MLSFARCALMLLINNLQVHPFSLVQNQADVFTSFKKNSRLKLNQSIKTWVEITQEMLDVQLQTLHFRTGFSSVKIIKKQEATLNKLGSLLFTKAGSCCSLLNLDPRAKVWVYVYPQGQGETSTFWYLQLLESGLLELVINEGNAKFELKDPGLVYRWDIYNAQKQSKNIQGFHLGTSVGCGSPWVPL